MRIFIQRNHLSHKIAVAWELTALAHGLLSWVLGPKFHTTVVAPTDNRVDCVLGLTVRETVNCRNAIVMGLFLYVDCFVF